MTSRAHEFALYRPSWWRDPSGLWVPADLPRAPAMPAPDALPEELRPQPPAIAVAERPPTDADVVVVYADEEAVGLPISSRAEVEAMAAAVPLVPALVGVARLAAVTYALPTDRDAQLRVAEEIFGKGAILNRLQAFTRSEKPRGMVFAEQNMFVLLRLLIEHAKESSIETPLTNHETAILNRALLASTAITGELSQAATQTRPRLEDWLAFFTQNGAYNSRAQEMGALARAQELFGVTARTSNVAASSNACPIQEWMVEDYGLTTDEQFTLGFALGAMVHAFDEDEAVGTQIYIAPENLHDLFVKLGWEDRETEALATIAAPRETYQHAFTEAGRSLEHIAWDVLPFMRHPFVKLAEGGLLLLSPRALFSWLTDGFHYRLLDAAQRRSAGDRRRKISRRYTAFAGELLEKYALDLVRSVHAGERPVGGGRVYGEQPYGRVNSKGNAAEHTSDIAIDLGLDLVLIEVSVSRLRAETLLLGDLKAVPSGGRPRLRDATTAPPQPDCRPPAAGPQGCSRHLDDRRLPQFGNTRRPPFVGLEKRGPRRG